MLASARPVAMTGGHGWQIAREADGPHEVRKAAREQIKAGADVVKFMATGGVMTKGVKPGSAQLTEEELKAGIEEAHKAGRRTSAHAQGTQGIINAIRAGIDSIEHGVFLTEEAARLMAEKGVFLVPTICALHCIEKNGLEQGIPPFAVKKTKKVKQRFLSSLRLAKEAGIKMAMGTDAGTPFNFHGKNALELELMVDLGGFTPQEAIEAATLGAARVVGLERELGSIEEGKLADIIVVRGNPLDDIRILQDREAILWIIKEGKVVKEDGRVNI